MKKGDLLLEIDPAPYQYTVDQLQAQLKAAKANVEQAKAAQDAANANVEKARDGIAQAQASVDQAKAAVANAQAGLNKAKSSGRTGQDAGTDRLEHSEALGTVLLRELHGSAAHLR